MILRDEQFGKKAAKHCKDWGLDPSSPEDREAFEKIIASVIDEADAVFRGSWRGYDGLCTFYEKGGDLVIVSPDDEWVTIMRGGATNKRYLNARKEVRDDQSSS